MATDRATSEFIAATAFKVTMYFYIVDEDEANPDDRNQKMYLATLMGQDTAISGTSYAYGDGSEFGPWLFRFTGSSTCNFDLPAGSSDIINMPVCFVNAGTAELLINPNGSDATTGADPFSIPAGDTTMYIFKWTGSGWVIK